MSSDTASDPVVNVDGTEYRADVYRSDGEPAMIWFRADTGRLTPDQADDLARMLHAVAAQARIGEQVRLTA